MHPAWTALLLGHKSPNLLAISEFPKWRKYLILLSFLDNSSARPVQIGGVDVNICHSRSTAVRGRRRSSSQSPPRGPFCRTRTGPVEADGAVDAQNAPTAPWKTLCVFHELPQGLSHQVTHEKLRKAPKYRWETRIDPICSLVAPCQPGASPPSVRDRNYDRDHLGSAQEYIPILGRRTHAAPGQSQARGGGTRAVFDPCEERPDAARRDASAAANGQLFLRRPLIPAGTANLRSVPGELPSKTLGRRSGVLPGSTRRARGRDLKVAEAGHCRRVRASRAQPHRQDRQRPLPRTRRPFSKRSSRAGAQALLAPGTRCCWRPMTVASVPANLLSLAHACPSVPRRWTSFSRLRSSSLWTVPSPVSRSQPCSVSCPSTRGTSRAARICCQIRTSSPDSLATATETWREPWSRR